MKRFILSARIGSECVFVGRYNTGLKIQTETVSKNGIILMILLLVFQNPNF